MGKVGWVWMIIMKPNRDKIAGNAFHVSFQISLLMKAISDLFEVIGGVLLIFINPDTAFRFIIFLTKKELSEDPKDLIANTLFHLGSSFSISTQYFGIIYLLSHGILKLTLVYLLWRRKLWAYPAAVVLLCLFVVYQIYRFFTTGSSMMIFLTVLDLAVIVLTLIEYKRQLT